MSWSQWLSLALVCLLGAMSPGPSLAVVVRHTVVAGTRAGVACAVTHGCGIFCWALLMVSGLGAILLTQPALFDTVRYLGAAFLFYLGCRAVLSDPMDVSVTEVDAQLAGRRAGWEGFLLALSNPKVAVFFAALFSQFIRPEATLAEQLMIASTAGAIDIMWYIIVAATLSNKMILERVKSRAALLNRCFGAILIVLSLAVLVSR